MRMRQIGSRLDAMHAPLHARCRIPVRKTCALPNRNVSDRAVPRQTILKIASASTACAKKPTVKASVRNTGTPMA